ncbi:MAG: terminase family protein [Alphaproteobacteria bacterium]|nr:terminase family protein [Alphaproteobacteria bacterium]MBU0875605.1 terminase family protein [Alphaproteobacteria bacterium]MBU1771310.1 terminase family protein [Alphaproteobacteria bacterium]
MTMNDVSGRLHGLDVEQRRRVLRGLTVREAAAFSSDWAHWAHEGQRAPAGDWRTWVLMAGRGYGKTRAGAEWVDEMARMAARAGEGLRIALVAATVEEARRVMIEGPSGLLAVGAQGIVRAEDGSGETGATGGGVRGGPRFEASRGRIIWPGGAIGTLYSGANPEGLRGPEHHIAWCDELAKWRHPQESWDNLQLGLRMGLSDGAGPRALVTTTPRAGCTTLRAILEAPDTVRTGGASGVNPHLPESWLRAVDAAYGGTALGRQEIEGLMSEDLAGSLWPAALIEACRGGVVDAGNLARIVIGVDPPASAAGSCGIVACGVDAADAARVAHVLADHSVDHASPERWARAVAAAVEAHGADRVVAEANQGGDMVRSVLASAGCALPVRLVTARRGKVARAEPVAALFEAGRARFAGRFPALEEQLRGLIAGGGYEGPGRSPDRADAMVWAMHALMLAPQGAPGIRFL